jgi:hypothetical protein
LFVFSPSLFIGIFQFHHGTSGIGTILSLGLLSIAIVVFLLISHFNIIPFSGDTRAPLFDDLLVSVTERAVLPKRFRELICLAIKAHGRRVYAIVALPQGDSCETDEGAYKMR